MKAHGLFGGKYVKIEKQEYELGVVGPNHALVAVKACGVCGTDLNFLRDCEGVLRPMGHELTGTVVEVGMCVKNRRFISTRRWTCSSPTRSILISSSPTSRPLRRSVLSAKIFLGIRFLRLKFVCVRNPF